MPQMKPRPPFRCEVVVLDHPPSRKDAVDSFYRSSFGAFLRCHFADLFTKPTQQTFLLLALGLVLSASRHTVANYLWRAGACAFKHFTGFYVFLGGPLYERLDWLFVSVIALAERHVPEGEPIRVRFDGTTAKKTGRQIDGADAYRNGAGSARQEYRTLWGMHFIIGEMLIRLTPWPEAFISVPIGLVLYIKEAKAETLGVPYRRRSELARKLLDRLCEVVSPARRVLSVQDGDYATQYFLRGLPENAHVVGRLPKNSPLYAEPTPKAEGKPGPQAKKGPRLGTAETLAEEKQGWQRHPEEAGAEMRLVRGIWHSVLPGVVLHVVLVRRPSLKQASSKKQRQRYLEAFFTTDLSLSLGAILREYQGRWSVEITIWQARQSFGLGQDRCRRYRRIVGINALRMVIVAAEVLWFADEVSSVSSMDLVQYRPWYVQKQQPSLDDIAWACREQLYGAGILPKVGFWDTVEVFHGIDPGGSGALPRAA